MVDKIKVNDKYEIHIGTDNNNSFVFEACRYNEVWLNCINVDGADMIMDMAFEINKLRGFYDYMKDLYGTGLEVAN